ncbi:MAG: sigma-54 dependent transcriptional regulator [Paracoccaceae bacterium]
MNAPQVLLIEDTAALQTVYQTVLRNAGFQVTTASDAAGGLRRFRRTGADVVLLDLMLPDADGREVLDQIVAARPDTSVVVITSQGSIDRAVEAMRAGACEFLVKPFDEQRLLSAVENAISTTRVRGAVAERKPAAAAPSSEFIGTSEVMRKVYDKVGSVARSMATVFVTGESGTGKELCAQAVHNLSARASGPFIALNCGAIPGDLLESEVFGHLKGSFTGAISDKPGAAAAADGGTLFLDEVCEMDLNLQTKLLRFLQTSMVQPVGATKPRKVNVRIICATNRDPLEEVRLGRFRADLFYRLHVVPIHLPPLRERGDDVIAIAETALQRFSGEEGRDFRQLSPEVAALFQSLPWPGNVRQVLNVMRNVVVLNHGRVVTPEMLPADLHSAVAGTVSRPGRERPEALQLAGLVGRPLAEIERIVIEETIAMNGGSVPRAARVLEVSPSTLYRKREAWAEGRKAAE